MTSHTKFLTVPRIPEFARLCAYFLVPQLVRSPQW